MLEIIPRGEYPYRGMKDRDLNEAQRAERDAFIWRCRRANWLQTEIAEEVGLSQAQVSKILASMAKIKDEETLSQVREMQLERLDQLANTFLAIADREHLAHNNGRVVTDPSTGERVRDSGPEIAAYSKYLDVLKERSKLLGLYAPEKVQHTGSVTVAPEIMSRMKAVMEADEDAV